MVRHETPGPDLNFIFLAPVCHQLDIGGIILVAEKGFLTTISSLGYMMWIANCYHSCNPSHGIVITGLMGLMNIAEINILSVRSNSLISSELKSRPRSCPYTSVAQGSGVLATGGRKFPIGKAAGRNESEPGCSLVKLK